MIVLAIQIGSCTNLRPANWRAPLRPAVASQRKSPQPHGARHAALSPYPDLTLSPKLLSSYPDKCLVLVCRLVVVFSFCSCPDSCLGISRPKSEWGWRSWLGQNTLSQLLLAIMLCVCLCLYVLCLRVWVGLGVFLLVATGAPGPVAALQGSALLHGCTSTMTMTMTISITIGYY